MPVTTRNKAAALMMNITGKVPASAPDAASAPASTPAPALALASAATSRAAPAPKRKRVQAPNAAAPTVASSAADDAPSAQEIEQEKKKRQQDRKNDHKRRNKLRDEAFQIVNDSRSNHEIIWQGLLKAIRGFQSKHDGMEPSISEAQVFRMCYAFYSLRFHHQMELSMSNYEGKYVRMEYCCPEARSWLIIFKRIDASSLIEQASRESTMLSYVAMKNKNDRSWRPPCFLYFTAFIFSFFDEAKAKEKIKVLSSILEGTASKKLVDDTRSIYYI